MADTHSPVLVRMTQELKAKLQREAAVHGRTLTGEINQRLMESFKAQLTVVAPSVQPYNLKRTTTKVKANDYAPDYSISEIERAMLSIFKAMPVEKQLALVSLFK